MKANIEIEAYLSHPDPENLEEFLTKQMEALVGRSIYLDPSREGCLSEGYTHWYVSDCSPIEIQALYDLVYAYTTEVSVFRREVVAMCAKGNQQ